MDKENMQSYTGEYYSAFKKKGILSFTTTWMNLLSEISQRDKYCMVTLTCRILKI